VSQAVSVPLAVVLVAALIAAVTDVWKFKVYNVLTLPLMAAGLLYHGVVGGMAGLSDGAVGLLVGFGALVIPHLMGGMGAGDVKLMAAIGAWLGMPLTLHVVLASALAAGAYAVVLALAGGKLRETILDVQVLWLRLTSMGRFPAADDRVQAETRRADRRRRLVPFAAMVAVGVVATLVWSEYPSTR
jgi:prepilin peptidase CpaA